MKYIVKAKNEKYNGTTAGVTFLDGVGETDSDDIATYLAEKGYKVLEAHEDQKQEAEVETSEEAENAEAGAEVGVKSGKKSGKKNA